MEQTMSHALHVDFNLQLQKEGLVKIIKRQICNSCLKDNFHIEIPETHTTKRTTRNSLLETRISVLETHLNLMESEINMLRQQLEELQSNNQLK